MQNRKRGRQAHLSDEEEDPLLDDLDLSEEDLSEEDNPADTLFSESSEEGEEEIKDYTYSEMDIVKAKVIRFVRDLNKNDPDSLPKTKKVFLEKIETLCEIQRNAEYQLVFAFLCAIEILSVEPRPEGEDFNEDEDDENDVYSEMINTVAEQQIVSFSNNWKHACNSKRTFSTIRKFPLKQQLILERVLLRLSEEDENSVKDFNTTQTLRFIVQFTKSTTIIPPEDVIHSLVVDELISLDQEKDGSTEITIKYSDNILTEPKPSGWNYWVILVLLVLISPALMRKLSQILGK
mmetsp:Transcript_2661/g.4306  ORF Transcript_2661/g.4306 Transcript_2661/m.4306 type:complete len:292 (+) Transcript_2661:35-910(+)